MKSSKWDIFSTFFMIGLTTFGGGYGMLAVMRHKLVEEKKWLTTEEMMEVLAVSESSPGPFAVNAATFIGYKREKFLGSLVATLGVVLPSLLISIILGVFLTTTGENKILHGALKGISAGISSVILIAFLSLSRKQRFTPLNTIIFLVSVGLVFFNVLSIIYIILIGAAFGIISGLIRDRKRGNNDEHFDIDA